MLNLEPLPDSCMLPIPTCGRCGRQVDLFTQHAGGIRENTYVFRAYCHGEMEETVLREMDIFLAGRAGIKAGVAFKQVPALPAEGCAER
jgi:hypothetical protein